MIHNPILPGFNPDPCICRKADDYYLAVSTFEWFPGIPVYHSKDLKNQELYTHVLTDDEKVDLKKLPSAKGIQAPCLTYCEKEDLFYVVYGVSGLEFLTAERVSEKQNVKCIVMNKKVCRILVFINQNPAYFFFWSKTDQPLNSL